MTEVVGGPLGKHAAPGRVQAGPFTVDRVLIILTTVAALLAVLVKQPCRVEGWSVPEHFYRGCYSDWTEAFQFQGVGNGLFPFLDSASTFDGPILMGVLAGVVALAVPGSDTAVVGGDAAVLYFDVNAVLISAAWIVTVIATARLASRRPWDAAIVALAPVAILTATSSWTFPAVMLGVLAMLAFAGHRYFAAGVLLGLGTGFSLHLLLVYGAMVLLAVRTQLWRPVLLTGTCLALTSILMAVPFGGSRGGPSWEYDPARIEVSASLWSGYNLLAERVGLAPLSPEATTIAAVAGFSVLAGLVVVLVLRAPRRPRLPQVVFLLVCALVLVLPHYRPEFTVWLLPFLALSYVDWRIFLGWQIVEVLHWWAYWMFVAREASGGAVENNIDSPYYVAAVLARWAATGYLMYRVAGQILEPAFDPVRRLDIDDPAGGPFDGAPDWSAGTPVGWNEPAPPPKNSAPKDFQ